MVALIPCDCRTRRDASRGKALLIRIIQMLTRLQERLV